MGKSSKKVKSDRINALKKQYDAFLAEDRMRKERNDFILDRLDKMRYCTAAVQLWHRPTMRVEGQAGTYHSGYKTENYTKYDIRESVLPQKYLPLDIPKNPLEETRLLQEISKNYILIPKQRPSFVNDCDKEISSNVKDHGDWKSKYEILNQLKQSEKEEDTYKMTAQESLPNLNKDKTLSDTKHIMQVINNSELNKYVNNDEDELSAFKIESPKKDRKSDNKLSDEFQYTDDKCENIYNALQSGNVSKQNVDNELEHHNVDAISGLKHELQNRQINVNPELNNTDTYANNTEIEAVNTFQAEAKCDPSLNTTINDIIKNENLQIENSNINIGSEHSSQIETYEQNLPVMDHNDELEDAVNVINLEESDRTSIPVINTNDMVRAFNHEPHVEDFKQFENVEYPIDIINAQEFTPNEDVKLQDGVNVNPEGHAMNQITLDSSPQGDHDIDRNNYDESTGHVPETEPQTEDVNNQGEISGIEAFDAEQREMFYSEQAEENYAYDHAGAGDAYNQEYAQNENYQQNEDYTYYEGAQPEQPMTEINEHEETAQRYDQNYEEQYAGYEQEGYAQEQVYEQQSQGYEPQVYDQVQPESDQMQYEQQNYETVDCIEQQLDNEQGYIEKHNEEDNEMEKPAQEQQQAEQVADL